MTRALLTFAHISDTHLHPDPEFVGEHIDFSSRQPVEALITYLNNLKAHVDFVLHTGDIVHNPEDDQHYAVASDVLARLDYPVHYVPGNHDDVKMFQRDFLGRSDDQIKPHCDYSFDFNGVQFAMVDSHAPQYGDLPEEESYKYHEGHVAPEQLEWLRAICAADDDRPLVVGIHHHVMPLQAPWLDRIVLENGAEVHEILLEARERLRGVFYGHIHESIVTVREGISYYSTQSGWFQTSTWFAADAPARDPLHNPGFNLVTITEMDTFVRFIRIPV